MPFITAIAIYFILWWVCLFLVLPWGIRGQHETGEVVKGSEPGAPVAPSMKRKVVYNSILAAIIWVIVFVVIKFHLVSPDDV